MIFVGHHRSSVWKRIQGKIEAQNGSAVASRSSEPEIEIYNSESNLKIRYTEIKRVDADSLLILMPSAIHQKRRGQPGPIFSRLSWESSWSHSHILALTDPALDRHPGPSGAWFIDPDYDVIAEIATFVQLKAKQLNVNAERILFYGSSIGGFGAIGAAAHLPQAAAVAEIPQINVEKWLPSAVSAIEKYITIEPISEYASSRNEQIHLKGRIEKAGTIPRTRIISNSYDASLNDQLDFVKWCQSSELPRGGPVELIITSVTNGHVPLEREYAVQWVCP